MVNNDLENSREKMKNEVYQKLKFHFLTETNETHFRNRTMCVRYTDKFEDQ